MFFKLHLCVTALTNSDLFLLKDDYIPNLYWYSNVRVDCPGDPHSSNQNKLTLDDIRASHGWTTGRYGDMYGSITTRTVRGTIMQPLEAIIFMSLWVLPAARYNISFCRKHARVFHLAVPLPFSKYQLTGISSATVKLVLGSCTL